MQVVTNQKKKEFVQWFLNTYKFGKKECTWLFNYLMSSELILDRVHFVDSFTEQHNKRITVHTNCSPIKPGYFEFNLNGTVTDEPEKCFHNIRKYTTEPVYVNLVTGSNVGIEWEDIIEPVNDATGYEVAAQLIMDQSFENYSIDQLKKLIDEALDEGNKELFMKLSNELIHTQNNY
jgi:uncharacterized protein YpiB (UPF0302 family)